MSMQLKNSPLTYVLVQVKISQILEVENYIPKLQEMIRKDFPLFKKINIQKIEIKQNVEKPEISTFNQWHFTDKNSTTGILIDAASIIFHTTMHSSFETLIDKFKKILSDFNKQLGITLYTRLGVRYVNCINSPIEKIIKKELQGFSIDNKNFFKGTYLTKTETTQITMDGAIKIQAIHVNDKNFIANLKNIEDSDVFISPDLKQVASYLSFDHHENKKPSKDYLILDIDNFSEQKNDFKVDDILKNLEKLHEGIDIAFKNAVTDVALKEWK